jgi:hypothetical protein
VKQLYARLEEYERANRSVFPPLFAAFAVYAFFILGAASRPLWHDELYTYYIAKQPSLSRLMDAVAHIDLQPPLQYVLSRISLSLFGDHDFATRLPSIVGFTAGSVCFYIFVRRRLGCFYGLTALLVFWLMPFLQYASEARPYSLVLGFFGLSMLSWQTATDGPRRLLGLLGLALGVSGMLLSQAFSPLLVAILGLAEFVRSVDRRKIDWPLWLALVAPSPLVAFYRPLIHRFQGWTALPPEFQASIFKIVSFYADLLSAAGSVLLVALIAALMTRRYAGVLSNENTFSARKHEIALVLGLLSLPILINLLLMRTGGAFWPRYCIPAGIGFSLMFIYILAKLTDSSRAAAALASLCVLLGMAAGIAMLIARPRQRVMVKELSLKQLDPSLPLVDASGLTFLEMNKREDAQLLSRLHYLTDSEAAVKYAHATIFEGMAAVRAYVPLGGSVTSYQDFIRRAPHFFVFGNPEYPEDWLIPKLLDDGAELRFRGEVHGTYRDHFVFEVFIHSGEASQK